MEESKYKAKILVVDDEEDICEILQYNLERAGYQVKCASDAEKALSLFSSEKFDLLLLDIMMGGLNGLELAKLLREDFRSTVPIIFVTALGEEKDILKGFSAGGDDYISKPFSVNQLVARVGAVLSRSGKRVIPDGGSGASSWKSSSFASDKNGDASPQAPSAKQTVFDFGILTVDSAENRVKVEGKDVMLTRKEMEILLLLSRSAGKLFSREDILKKVWKNDGFVLERTVDVHIARLRKKLGVAGELIQNRSGFGYCIHSQDK